MGKLDGKVAIVTGAARGLGRANAKRLTGLGAKVAVADLNLRSYEEFEGRTLPIAFSETVGQRIFEKIALYHIDPRQRSRGLKADEVDQTH